MRVNNQRDSGQASTRVREDDEWYMYQYIARAKYVMLNLGSDTMLLAQCGRSTGELSAMERFAYSGRAGCIPVGHIVSETGLIKQPCSQHETCNISGSRRTEKRPHSVEEAGSAECNRMEGRVYEPDGRNRLMMRLGGAGRANLTKTQLGALLT